MKKLILIVFVTVFSMQANAQKFDLIVTVEGDSIACRIDSISSEKIYFKMMKDYEWIKKDFKKEFIIKYKKDAFHKKSLIFKEETSYISKVIEDKPVNSVKDIRRNSFYAEIGGNAHPFSVSYDRVFPLSKSSALVPRIGLGLGVKVYLAELNYIYGGTKHFFESGVGSTTNIHTYLISFRAGYRLQTESGFMLRAAPLVLYNKFEDSENPWDLWFGISIGYSL